MAKEEEKDKLKLIAFSKPLEAAIETDAKRCRRSFVRQVEAVLTAYYAIEDTELDRSRLEILGTVAPTSGTNLPIINVEMNGKKKKKKA